MKYFLFPKLSKNHYFSNKYISFMVYTALRGDFLKKNVNFMVYPALRGEFLKKCVNFMVSEVLTISILTFWCKFLKIKDKFHDVFGPFMVSEV